VSAYGGVRSLYTIWWNMCTILRCNNIDGVDACNIGSILEIDNIYLNFKQFDYQIISSCRCRTAHLDNPLFTARRVVIRV